MILSLETASPVCSVALHQSGKLVACYELYTENSHGEKLTVLIQEICKQNYIELSDLLAVAVSKGPGSYTGLRIGVSTAKGLCYALQKPLVAVNTLEAMLEQVADCYPNDTLLCPFLEARRTEIYCLLANSKRQILMPTSAIALAENHFEGFLTNHKIVFFGIQPPKHQAILKHPNATFIENIHPSAKYIGKLAWQKFCQKDFENLLYFEPFYLKDFIASKKQ